MRPTKFRFIWPNGFRGEEFIKSANQKQELPVAAMFVNGSGQNVPSSERTVHRFVLPSFGSFGQTVSEEKNLKNQPIKNKSRLWRSCLLTDRSEMSNLYRDPSIDASYQVLVHLAKRFQRRRFFKIGQSETRIACGGQVCQRIGTKCATFREDCPYMLPTKFRFIWPNGFRGEEF
jgi:hypothetical protein